VTSVYVAPVSFGLGDLVVSLPAIQGLIAQNRRTGAETWLVARSPAQRRLSTRIDGLAGVVDEDTFHPSGIETRLVDLRDHPLQRDYWWGSPEFESAYGWMSINDILDRICHDLGVDADFSGPVPLTAYRRSELRDTVLLIADSDGPAKCWPVDRWALLASGVRQTGAGVAALTRSAGSDIASAGVGEVRAPTPGDAVDLLSSCLAVVGVDTGLTHIAVQQGTPTITLCRSRPVFFRPWPHCRAVIGEPCDTACVAAERERAHNQTVSLPGLRWRPWACRAGGRCMASIRSDDVVDALHQLLSPLGAGGNGTRW
jgi:hypothetical protein